MMDVPEVETVLLSSATEDYFALYEAIWEINSRFPDETLGRKYETAEMTFSSPLVGEGGARREAAYVG